MTCFMTCKPEITNQYQKLLAFHNGMIKVETKPLIRRHDVLIEKNVTMLAKVQMKQILQTNLALTAGVVGAD